LVKRTSPAILPVVNCAWTGGSSTAPRASVARIAFRRGGSSASSSGSAAVEATRRPAAAPTSLRRTYRSRFYRFTKVVFKDGLGVDTPEPQNAGGRAVERPARAVSGIKTPVSPLRT
jgi:hypothetical protein